MLLLVRLPKIESKIVAFSCAIALWGIPLFAPLPAAATELREIVRRGQLIVAVKANHRPLGFTDAEGNLQGLEIDIARKLAEELLGDPNAVVFRPVTNQERLRVLLSGEVDLAIANLAATRSRARIVNFSRYYYLDGTGLVTKDASVQRLADVASSKIAVLKGSSAIAHLRYELPDATLVGVDSYRQAYSLLETEEVRAFAADRSILVGWVQEYTEYKFLSTRLSGEALSIAMPKGLQHSTLYLRVNDAISRWQKSGWLQARIDYWGLPN